MAVQMLYQGDLGDSAYKQILRDFSPRGYGAEGIPDEAASAPPETEAKETLEYAKALVAGALEHLSEIDELIGAQADNWRLERMPAVDRNVLRLAVFEFLYETDVPKLVVLDEAIELAKKFGSEQSGKFVNGLLDGLLKSHDFPGTVT